MAIVSSMPNGATHGAVELVDAAVASYTHPELRWLFERHLLALVTDFPSLSPSVDTYTGDDGTATALLNAQGLLAVSSSMPPLLLTIWLPQDYPFEAPMVYVFPAQASSSLVPDHPFVDHRTGRVLHTLPCLDKWKFPGSGLAEIARSLVKNFRMCHPYVNDMVGSSAHGMPPSPSPSRTELLDELVARLDIDRAVFRSRVDDDIDRLSAVQDKLRARGNAIDRAVSELGEERMRLEHAVTASMGHCDVLRNWLQDCIPNPVVPTDVEVEAFEAGDERSRQWVESKASELAIDDTMDALADALEKEVVSFGEYMKHVRVLAREQFFHCHTATLLQKQLSKKNKY